VLTERVSKVVEEWAAAEGWGEVPSVELGRPAEEAHGDYATPLCLQMAKQARRAPRVLAEALRERLLADEELSRLVDKIEVAGPGFLNFTLSGQAYATVMAQMLEQGDEVGRGIPRAEPRINLEFVSVNPNGPLHVGHGRYAAYGDSLRRLLAFSGANVSAEFYINDYGRQMDRFGKSVAARYAQSQGIDLPVPEDGYQGDYVRDTAAAVGGEDAERWLPALRQVAEAVSGAAGTEWPDDADVAGAVAFFRNRGCSLMLEEMKAELAAFGVLFDCWFSETTLHESGRLERVIDELLGSGEAYRDGDAIWLRTTSRGDDKDRVLIRSNEQPTYFAADIAYHEDKLERGFDHLINI